MNNYKSGYMAEFLAKSFLILKGYKILANNYRTGKGTHAGEIDLVVRKGKTLVFVEVKKRKTMDDAAFAVSETQKRRIINGAKAFLKYHPQYNAYDMRFDAILVKLPLTIKHLKNAWSA